MRRLGFVLLACLLGFAACGDDEEPDTASTTSTPTPTTTAASPGSGQAVSTTCPVAEADVAALVGAEIADRGAQAIEDGSTSCFWTIGDSSITVNLQPGGGPEAHDQYDRISQREDVDGLGDDARWAPQQRVLTVLAGDDVVMVLVESGIEDPLRVATGIAELALATL